MVVLAQLQQHYGDLLEIAYRQREPGAIVIDFIVQQPIDAAAAAQTGCGCGSGGCS